ncbi:MAG: hypothetical protein QXS90_01205 [Candidatus Diapherotrites archaeon]
MIISKNSVSDFSKDDVQLEKERKIDEYKKRLALVDKQKNKVEYYYYLYKITELVDPDNIENLTQKIRSELSDYSGETGVNYEFFTEASICQTLPYLIEKYTSRSVFSEDNVSILECSAGIGNIAYHLKSDNNHVTCVEIHEYNHYISKILFPHIDVFVHGDYFRFCLNAIEKNVKYDFIVSNPPYFNISKSDINKIENIFRKYISNNDSYPQGFSDVKNYISHVFKIASLDTLKAEKGIGLNSFYRIEYLFIFFALLNLKDNGVLCFVLPHARYNFLHSIFFSFGFYNTFDFLLSLPVKMHLHTIGSMYGSEVTTAFDVLIIQKSE